MNLKQEMEDFGFTSEDVKMYTKGREWYIRYAKLDLWCTRTFNYGNIHEDTFKTFSAFARAWNAMLEDKTKKITGWTGCNSGGY